MTDGFGQNAPFGHGGAPNQGGMPAPGAGGPYRTPPPAKATPTEAIIALVLAISTMMTTCFPLGFVGLWLGSKARKKAQIEGDKTGETLGLISMILGGIMGGLWGLFWLAYAAMFIIPIVVVLIAAAAEGM